MNRRSFITDMLKAGVACTFLPGAGRIWKPSYEHVEVLGSRLYLNELFQILYEIKTKREQAGLQNTIIIDRYRFQKLMTAEHISHFERPETT